MPRIQAVSGLNRNLAVQARAERRIAQAQDGFLGIGQPGGMPRGNMVSYVKSLFSLGMARTFFQFWIDQIQEFKRQLKASNSLASSAQ